MSESTGGAIPAGWYADPANAAQLRWWDGNGWTAHVAPTPAPTPVAPPVVPVVSDYQTTDASGRPYVPMQQMRTWEREETSTSYTPAKWNTTSSWLLATSLLWGLALQLVGPIAFGWFENPTVINQTPSQLVSLGAELFVAILVILLAISDRITLRRWGYDRVAHWAWIFLSPLAYLIARTIYLRAQVRRGVAPLVFYCVSGAVIVLSAIAAAIAIPLLIASSHGTINPSSEFANSQQLAAGIQSGMDKSSASYQVSCAPFAQPTTTAIREQCNVLDPSGTNHVMTIEIDPPATPGGQPSVHLISVTPPLTGSQTSG